MADPEASDHNHHPDNQSLILNSVNSSVQAVRVYADQALVTRRGKVAIAGGQPQELVIPELPLSIATESIRASGTGNVAVKLLGVRTERVFATVPIAAKVAQLTAQIKELEAEQQNLQDRINTVMVQRDFIESLAEKSVTHFAIGLSRQQATLDQTRALLDFVGQQHLDYATAIAATETAKLKLEAQIQALRQQLNSLKNPRPTESYSIIVTVEADTAGDFDLEVSYVVSRANWKPLYDLQACETSVKLSYLAEVEQSSGEDWLNVQLVLSTAKPGVGTLPPQLPPWYVDVYKPPIMLSAPMPGGSGQATLARRRAQPASYSSASRDDDDTTVYGVAEEFEAGYETQHEAQSVAAAVRNEGGVVTFALDRNGDIPSDGNPHKLVIFSDDYPCRWEYVAFPKRVGFAYLQAIVSNPGDGVVLLPGTANIFRQQEFIGTTNLENIAPGQEFKLNLGIDESIKIERNLVEREVDKRFISGQRRTIYAYRLLVSNLNSDRAITLKLTEQLPVSRNEQIKVRLLRTVPQVAAGEMNLLEWTMTLPALAKQEIYYQFAVEHPPDLTVVGLEI